MEVLDAMRRMLRREKMLFGADRVICALSGGADSICLAHAMRILAPELGIRVECAHFNHLLRGEESRRDEDFVRRWCREQGLPLTAEQGDVAAFAEEKHLSVETAARELRYAFLDSLGDSRTRIATAHQADDQAETVLLQLTRGSGLRGLCGIPPVRGRYIRPMLELTRDDVLTYLAANGLDHVEDSTNAENIAARNRIRHDVIPVLRTLNPDFCRTAVRTARLLREDDDTLTRLAEPLLTRGASEVFLSVSRLRSVSRAVASRAVRLAAAEMGTALEEKHTELVLELVRGENPSAELDLPGGITAARSYDDVRLGPPKEPICFPERKLSFGAWTEIPELGLSVFCGPPGETGKIYGKFTTWFFKKEQICGNINVRPRMAGDCLRLPGRPGKTLKKWMVEQRIPAGERESLPVLADERGVLGVLKIGMDERAAAKPEEADAVIIFWERT